MRTGQDPPIEFEKVKFEEINSYLSSDSELEGFDIDNAPPEIPKSVIEEMEEIGFLEFRNLGDFKVYFCGYGVVGKGWGFINGEFTQEEIDHPGLIKGSSNQLNLTFLEHVEGRWFRFGVG